MGAKKQSVAELNALIPEVNAVRAQHGGAPFTAQEMYKFCFYGGRMPVNNAVFARWLRGWRDAYTATGPKLDALGLSIDVADKMFGKVPEVRDEHAGFIRFVDRLVAERAGGDNAKG